MRDKNDSVPKGIQDNRNRAMEEAINVAKAHVYVVDKSHKAGLAVPDNDRKTAEKVIRDIEDALFTAEASIAKIQNHGELILSEMLIKSTEGYWTPQRYDRIIDPAKYAKHLLVVAKSNKKEASRAPTDELSLAFVEQALEDSRSAFYEMLRLQGIASASLDTILNALAAAAAGSR